MEAIVKETVEYYGADPARRRGVVRDFHGNVLSCKYFYNGMVCAVGRCVNDAEAFQKKWGTTGAHSIPDLDTYMRPEYKGNATDFWTALQVFHDTKEFWSARSITSKGLKEYKRLQQIER